MHPFPQIQTFAAFWNQLGSRSESLVSLLSIDMFLSMQWKSLKGSAVSEVVFVCLFVFLINLALMTLPGPILVLEVLDIQVCDQFQY